jgi:hypothetical protein
MTGARRAISSFCARQVTTLIAPFGFSGEGGRCPRAPASSDSHVVLGRALPEFEADVPTPVACCAGPVDRALRRSPTDPAWPELSRVVAGGVDGGSAPGCGSVWLDSASRATSDRRVRGLQQGDLKIGSSVMVARERAARPTMTPPATSQSWVDGRTRCMSSRGWTSTATTA